ncbi:MAG: efflux RND transporter permease subunit [candidate division KSB1 bacterium]|nr:efflux RND transporter permease subunit [candidate division KSB1 bacterium]MDZ7274377.1 efflux RND transporter permease subunit [candidate division KSB1 bacterium]MDZ7284961.1 efflux RND transporter permease subunit [candidate division KSB1 bacterium]MDZ7297618.1 efflux RND transporter permease subunit [candidate division KSB1 bacterium]MDZ7306358.1 efflux RND transporter permease subunit [candidate division KSB1 bacterium]
MTLTEVSIKRPAFITMVFTALAALGIFAYSQMGVDLLPKMDWPMVSVVTIYPGAGPKEVESEVSKPIEEALSSLNGLKHIRSFSNEGVSVLLAEFSFTTDVEVATNEVQRKVDGVRAELPKDIYTPTVTKSDINDFPIVRIALSSRQLDSRALYQFADEYVAPRLEQLPGVSSVTIVGGRQREIRIEVDNDRLRAYNLSIVQVSQALQRENLDFPTGKINSRENQYLVRVAGKFTSPQAMNNIVLAAHGDSRIYLRDVAQVLDTFNEDVTYTRLNGEPALGLYLQRQSGSNSVQVAGLVRAELAKIENEQQGRIHFEVAQDITQFTLHSVNEVKRDLGLAVLMVALVLFVFLHSFRNSFIVLLSIPTSLITTFIMMQAFAFTINLVSLMALALVIGILVDDSIVVLENIHRHLEHGEAPQVAALRGRNEIGFAAVAITLVDVVVFLPIALIGGIVGKIFKEFGLTIVVSTLLSLFVSFTLTPMLAAKWSRAGRTSFRWPWLHKIIDTFETWQQNLNERYRHLLAWSLDHRKTVVATSFALLLASLALVPLGAIGTEFISEADRGEFAINLEMPIGTALDLTDQATRRVESLLAGMPEVTRYLATVGKSQSEWSSTQRPNVAQIAVTLKPKRERERSTAEVMNAIAAASAKIPGLVVRMSPISMFGAAQEAPLQIEVKGPDLETLARVAEQVANITANVAGTRDVKSSWEEGQPEIQIAVDRERAAHFGLTLGEIGVALRTALEGDIATKFKDGNSEFDTRVVLAKANRSNPADVEKVTLVNYRGERILLGQVAKVHQGKGPTIISRKDRERLITVSSNLDGTVPLGRITQEIQRRGAAIVLPSGVTIAYAGDVQNMQDMFRDMMIAIGFAALFVYMIMVALFESYAHPFTIMFSIPVALVGGLGALALTGQTLNMFSMIGILLSMGLVTKNAILLVDRTNEQRSRGLSVREALLEAGPTRLRPILMTTLTMVLGMTPLALALGAGSEIRQSMAIVVIGALISSTLLTLVLVPVIYTYVEGFRRRLARRQAEEGNGRLEHTHTLAAETA